MIQLTDKQKKLLKWVGYPLLAIVVFVFAIFWTFPYDRLKDKIVEKVGQKYDITISDIGPTIMPGGIVLSSVTLQERPDDPDKVPSMLFFEEIEIDVGLMSLLFGSIDVDIVAETASGKLEAEITADSLDLKKAESFKIWAQTENLQLGSLPGVREGVGLPVSGGLNAELELTLPKMKFKEAEGFFKFKCGGCTIGDGESKIKPKLPPGKENDPRYKRRLAMYGEGITVPRLSLGAAEAEINIKKGVGKIEKLSTVSGDGEMSLEGEIRFADPFKASTLPGCLRFKLSEDLKKREKDFGNIDLILDAKRGDDGFFAFPTQGKLTSLRWNTRKPCAEDGVGAAKATRPRIRPRTRPATGGNTSAVRRAAGKDADEPEVKGVGRSGPKLDVPKRDTARDRRNSGDDVGNRDDNRDRDRGDDVGDRDDDRDRGDDVGDRDDDRDERDGDGDDGERGDGERGDDGRDETYDD